MKKKWMIIIGFMGLIGFMLAGLFVFSCNQDSDDDDDNDDDSDDDDSGICNSTCWQYSPEQATGSLDQVEQWTTECEQADPGCEDKVCVATYIEFYNAPDEYRYSIQCETGIPDDQYGSCFGTDALVNNGWLGPDYGVLAESINLTGLRGPTGWAISPGFIKSIEWKADKIADALAHDISEVPCEQIEDYRQCVRAFIPPDIHCTPAFDETKQFDHCHGGQEPYGRDIGWLDEYNQHCTDATDE